MVIMEKLFRENEMVSFKNEKQKNKILYIAVEFNVNWPSGDPFSYSLPEKAIGICFNRGEGLGFLLSKGQYEVISVKKLLKRVEKYREENDKNLGSTEVEESGWRKKQGTAYMMYHDIETGTKFGFNVVDTWLPSYPIEERSFLKASGDEVLPRLKKEAEKRGFIVGTRVNNVNIGYRDSDRTIEKDFEYCLNLTKNTLIVNRCAIMHNGEWAEIVKDKAPFKPVFMKCTKKQFLQMKPKLESVGADLLDMNHFTGECCWLVNNFSKRPLNIDVFASGYASGGRTEVHTEAEFLASCGYTEEPYVPKVGDFGVFWDNSCGISGDNEIGFITEIGDENFFPFRAEGGKAYDNFTLLPKETESIFMDIKNREVEK